jgi:uncharacterized DUF497 family protein
MEFEFDPAKDRANVERRGLSLALAPLVFERLVTVFDDDRKDYGERRQIAYGMIGNRLHVVVFTDRDPVRRIISLRKANRRECDAYCKDHGRHDEDGALGD